MNAVTYAQRTSFKAEMSVTRPGRVTCEWSIEVTLGLNMRNATHA